MDREKEKIIKQELLNATKIEFDVISGGIASCFVPRLPIMVGDEKESKALVNKVYEYFQGMVKKFDIKNMFGDGEYQAVNFYSGIFFGEGEKKFMLLNLNLNMEALNLPEADIKELVAGFGHLLAEGFEETRKFMTRGGFLPEKVVKGMGEFSRLTDKPKWDFSKN